MVGEKKMRHLLDCPEYSRLDGAENQAPDCDWCKANFEKWQGVCPHCWLPVSNSTYFGKRGKSAHLDGKCSVKQTAIPASWLERRTDRPRHDISMLASYWASSKNAENPSLCQELRTAANYKIAEEYKQERERERAEQQEVRENLYPSKEMPNAEMLKLVALMEEQNRLLKQLAA
jgi:hypothetical protein